MPNTLTEKAIKQPFRVGLMLGALIIPCLWTLSQDVLKVLIHKPLLNSEEITLLFAVGFVPDMILGACITRAWVEWRAGKIGEARGLLITNGFTATIISLLIFFLELNYPAQLLKYSLPQVLTFFYFNFPLQCALAVLLFGIFMRSPRT